MKIQWLAALAAIALFAGCGSADLGTSTSTDSVALTGLSLSSKTLSFTGATSGVTTQTLTATGVPVFYSENIVWTSSNTAVAKVAGGTLNKSGVVTAVGNGTATITASNQNGTVVTSAAVTVALETTAPGTVSNVVSEPYGSNVVLSWTNPADTDLSYIMVLCVETSELFNFPAADAGGTVTGLSSGTPYTFNIFAVDADDNVGALVQCLATTGSADSEAPGKVTDLVATNTGVGEVTLAWSAPSDSDYRGVLVQITSSSSGATIPASFEVLESKGNSAVVSGLSSGKTYVFRVISRDWNLNQASAAMVSTTTNPSVLAVTDFTGSAGYTGQVVLTWLDPLSSDVASFLVTAVGVSTKSVELGVGQVVFNNLTVGTAYTFTIASVLEDGTTMPEVQTVIVTPVTVKYLIPNGYDTATVYYLNSAYTSTYTANNDVIISKASEYVAGTSPANVLWTAYPGLADPENPKSISLVNAGALLNGRYLRFNSASPNTVPGVKGQYYDWSISYIQTNKYWGWVDANDGTDTFKKDATFYVRSANNGTSSYVSFAWYQDKTRYLTADAWHVFGRRMNDAINNNTTSFTFGASSSWLLLKQ